MLPVRRKQGWGGLYQGFQAGLASSALGCGLGFTTYEALTVAYRNSLQRAPTPSERGTLAGCAAFCTISACMPLEVIMRRLQARQEGGHARPRARPSFVCICYTSSALQVIVVFRTFNAYVKVMHVQGQSALPDQRVACAWLSRDTPAASQRADTHCSQCSACICVHLQTWRVCRCKAAQATPCCTAGRWTACARSRRRRACEASTGLV